MVVVDLASRANRADIPHCAIVPNRNSVECDISERTRYVRIGTIQAILDDTGDIPHDIQTLSGKSQYLQPTSNPQTLSLSPSQGRVPAKFSALKPHYVKK